MVDGDFRGECALAALPKLKLGGVIIIDNVERYLPHEKPSCSPNSRSLNDGCESDSWSCFKDLVDGWRSIWTSNGVCDTALWIKPYQ